ncbi:alpha/beta hydrolase [Streptomyces sp. NA04227]|uniref:alpha/beta fold hydrolase n=1 Tax=Streptomyces sp. NA04227 TaxID=2742136 RepID=UPI0015904B17|nr:alpha/beta hydrolase [Streptomyces sp. NA04227]QKW09916.1 alpha/beta hydrolase [Streptomyces sp. NA04227]
MSSFVLPHALHGSGPHKVIAVHGWLADRSAYDPLLPDLDGRSFQYAFVDLRGYGKAVTDEGPFTTERAAEDVRALASQLGWKRYSLIGHSMGGSIVQRAAAAAPEQVRRIVGVSPVPASGLPLPPEAWELFAGAAENPENRRAIMDNTTGGTRPDAWLDRMVRRSLARSDARAFRAWLDSWAKDDFHTEVAGSAVPALAVVGALDPALSAEVQRQTWMRWYVNAELAELPSAGHYAMDEDPLGLLRIVEDFLRADETEGPSAGAGASVTVAAGDGAEAGARAGAGAGTGAGAGADA